MVDGFVSGTVEVNLEAGTAANEPVWRNGRQQGRVRVLLTEPYSIIECEQCGDLMAHEVAIMNGRGYKRPLARERCIERGIIRSGPIHLFHAKWTGGGPGLLHHEWSFAGIGNGLTLAVHGIY